MTPNPQDSAVALEVERAIREALDAGPTPCEWSAMLKPSAAYSDHGWRAVAMCGAKWMVGAPSRVMLAEGGWNNEANAALMAACNPDAMRSLLAEIDCLRASQSDGTLGVPDGWKLVPAEPTDDMEAAAENDYEDTGATFPNWKSAYRAMLAAASRVPNQSQGENHVG